MKLLNTEDITVFQMIIGCWFDVCICIFYGIWMSNICLQLVLDLLVELTCIMNGYHRHCCYYKYFFFEALM